jgi:DNA-binding HxlR family transcriptional regulator
MPFECPLKMALKFLSGAWTAEIYWALRQGPLRFGQLQRSIGDVSAKVLTQRLRDLEDLDIVDRKVIDTRPPQVEYALTPLGQSFTPVLEAIAETGRKLIRKSRRKVGA